MQGIKVIDGIRYKDQTLGLRKDSIVVGPTHRGDDTSGIIHAFG